MFFFYYLALVFGIACFIGAFRRCGTRGRILLVAMISVPFGLPYVYPGPATGHVGLALFIAVCVGCFFYTLITAITDKIWW